jgi:hypothetical protein
MGNAFEHRSLIESQRSLKYGKRSESEVNIFSEEFWYKPWH